MEQNEQDIGPYLVEGYPFVGIPAVIEPDDLVLVNLGVYQK
jgi:hypothetical protein